MDGSYLVPMKYRGLQVGWHKFATRIRACAEFLIQNSHQKSAHARIFVAILCQPTCKPLYCLRFEEETSTPACKHCRCYTVSLQHLVSGFKTVSLTHAQDYFSKGGRGGGFGPYSPPPPSPRSAPG